ncbi:hypothetical protein FISHEDRAFT_75599 [Fistulina hepatica ATCC 64428]|uniref:Uncharacterized protein n=1 Tax=Fistulina hepatica ATCC 64428 TaxID=1128425 RepID=A0A0D7A6P1_9AGAR|nr:hypothetical protein FISHEDRAFT_75599 [Fistulina hepatica ATCC 64428]
MPSKRKSTTSKVVNGNDAGAPVVNQVESVDKPKESNEPGMSKELHVARARRWETSPWTAQWLAMSVAHCRGKGRHSFEEWLKFTKPPLVARRAIDDCFKKGPSPPIIGKCPGKGVSNARNFNRVARELGMSDTGLQHMHEYASETEACTPPRVKPAPRRRRGEPTSEWLARRHAALLEGCKAPDFNWLTARAIAISELDRVRDTADAWRFDYLGFTHTLAARAKSIITSQREACTPYILIPHLICSFCLGANVNDIFVYASRTTSSTPFSEMQFGTATRYSSHSCWLFATELFEDLARRGLCTAAAIERAYLQDEDLVWRLFCCGARAREMFSGLWAAVIQTVSYTPYFRPYFKRWRSSDGMAHIDKAPDGPPLTVGFDCFVVQFLSTDSNPEPFFDQLSQHMNSENARKFDAESFDAIGEFAVAQEFCANMTNSPFGDKLRRYALAKAEQAGGRPAGMLKYICAADPRKLNTKLNPGNHFPFGEGSKILNYVLNSFSLEALSFDGAVTMAKAAHGPDLAASADDVAILLEWDRYWMYNDETMWRNAALFDRPGVAPPAGVARDFGLRDPRDPLRPLHSFWGRKVMKEVFQKEEEEHMEREKRGRTTAAPAAPTREDESSPMFETQASEAMSVHAYVITVAAESQVKTKKKTKGKAGPAPKPAPSAADATDDLTLDDMPDAMPCAFKLPKKVIKVFHRILVRDENDESVDQKKGQVRWGDFEKAMRRVGFDVVQTTGSSVRFDPPAKTARPISFHRPHPDSILDPHMIKWVGARLNRCYGWTTATFELSEGGNSEVD